MINCKLITDLANTQLGKWVESKQEESYEEAEIVSKSWLQEPAQILKIQKNSNDGITYMAIQLIEVRV